MNTTANSTAQNSVVQRRRGSSWRTTARALVTCILIAECVADQPLRAFGQTGQSAMAPAGGVVNRAVAGLQDLNGSGPGWMYYGINAADRGLGYRGSYMTVGGFIPYAEDDLGGFWSADMRGHLSNYGGFFSNVGIVRKQFIGGALGGIGIYWDYDGDQNQYSSTTITDTSGSYTFAGGQTYQQVGISGEFLTDWGNLRSNGYIPCGNTAQIMGPFVGNSLLCQNGINAGLAGTDLELGAYVPGLSDWAGMVSVGGYAYGNARYNLSNGQDVVPWFGGVYTRLDMTLIENWDFSLQYNNDSYFDSTGFARLTYRMGGSRRRNVPDQMEQPMMRNEHIVRAHQAPEQAINPNTSAPWRVIHVDNATSVTAGGTGTAESPVTTLADAQTKAANPYDIVFVHSGNSANSPYTGSFTFQANNQYLVGQGTSLQVPTANCGFIPIWANGGTSGYPVISNPSGTSIELTNGGATNTTVDHLQILGSQVGISDGVGLPLGGSATVNDVLITGNNSSQTGVVIQDLAGGNGTFDFKSMTLQSLTADGFVVDGQGAGGSSPQVNISSSTINNTSGSAIVVNYITNQGRVRFVDSSIDGTTAAGVSISGGNAIIESSTFTNIGTDGVSVSGKPVTNPVVPAVTSGTSTVQVVGSTINAFIGVQGSSPNSGDVLNLTINQNTLISPAGGNGINLAVSGTGAGGIINTTIVGNKISATPSPALFSSGTSTTPVPLASNIFLTTSGTSLTNLTIKAANQDNLVALNRSATVTSQPLVTGTSVLPPPNYNPAVIVPLPAP